MFIGPMPRPVPIYIVPYCQQPLPARDEAGLVHPLHCDRVRLDLLIGRRAPVVTWSQFANKLPPDRS